MLLVTAIATAGCAGDSNRVTYESALPQFMCVACHEPLELVSSREALSEQATLRGFVDKGLPLSGIKSAMVQQYGPQVLAKPSASGFNLTLYVLPPVALLAGVLLLAYTLPKWRERSRKAAASPPQSAPPLDPEEQERLNTELDQFI